MCPFNMMLFKTLAVSWRRLVGPMTLWEESEGGLRWDAPVEANSLVDGLVQLGTSPRGVEDVQSTGRVATLVEGVAA